MATGELQKCQELVETATKSNTPVTKHSDSNGYDCEFVKRPPEVFQSTCPICLLVLREPHQLTCCGYSFCQPCVKLLDADKKGCPTCNEAEYTVFPNKGLKRSLHSYRVYCSYKKEGCGWEGELGELDAHFNVKERLGECEYVSVKCTYCFQHCLRRDVRSHETKDCTQRPFTCEHCHDFKATFEKVVNDHFLVCASFPLSCPNDCGSVIQRQQLELHTSHDCPLTVVGCDFQEVGCEIRLFRKDMPSHVSDDLVGHLARLQMHMAAHPGENMAKHMCLLVGFVHKLTCEFKATKERAEKAEKKLAGMQATLEEMNCEGTLPFEFTFPDFEEHKKSKIKWFSDPFYSHTQGYKLCICVQVNVRADNSFRVLVDVFLMKGEYDHKLEWPFCGNVSIKLFNQHEDSNHLEWSTRQGNGSRVSPNREISTYRYNNTWSINLDSRRENVQYLKSDALMFRVVKVSDITLRERLERFVSKRLPNLLE